MKRWYRVEVIDSEGQHSRWVRYELEDACQIFAATREDRLAPIRDGEIEVVVENTGEKVIVVWDGKKATLK